MIRCMLAAAVVAMSVPQVTAQQWHGFGGPNSDHHVHVSEPASWTPSLNRTMDFGEGRSGIVVDEDIAFISYLEPFDESEDGKPTARREHRESVVAINVQSGKTVWRFTSECAWLEDQETFGGRMRAPQSTPLLIEDARGDKKVITIRFDGKLHALDRETGDEVWSVDLVKRCGAVPVQFGFSSSPVEVDGKIVVLAGGDHGGLIALDPSSGKQLWSQPCGEASYATPVVAEFEGRKQIVFVTRNRVVAVDPEGKLIWEKPLDKLGLTNVPTPLVLSDGLVLSGQGFGGTTRWSVRKRNGVWEVDPVWVSDQQFFYCNWVVSGDHILGCPNQLLVAIDLATGKTLQRRRGYSESNVALAGDVLLVAHGKDQLSCLRFADGDFVEINRWRHGQGRCWTPPTWIGDMCLLRAGTQVLSINLNAARSNRSLERVKQVASQDRMPQNLKDPVSRVVAAYESEGAETAMKVYEDARAAGSLKLVHRMRLAEMAIEIEQPGLASKIAGDALDDAASDEERANVKKWLIRAGGVVKPGEQASKVGENGLTYVKIGLLNLNATTRHAEVRGPKKHPFGYGLPLRRAQVRRESWPVGTRLTEEGTGKLLLEVKLSDAGKVVIIE